MVTAERAGAATGADQSFLRFDHPTMVNELMAMEAPEGEPILLFFVVNSS